MTDHAPGALPQITLGGKSFYIRSGSLVHDPKNVAFSDRISLNHKRRRLVGAKSREWTFTIAARSWEDRLALEAMMNETLPSYIFEFEDGAGSTYNVTIDGYQPMTPVANNTDYWDVGQINLVEWI